MNTEVSLRTNSRESACCVDTVMTPETESTNPLDVFTKDQAEGEDSHRLILEPVYKSPCLWKPEEAPQENLQPEVEPVQDNATSELDAFYGDGLVGDNTDKESSDNEPSDGKDDGCRTETTSYGGSLDVGVGVVSGNVHGEKTITETICPGDKSSDKDTDKDKSDSSEKGDTDVAGRK